MARSGIELRKTDTIFDELERLHQAISRRAYDVFRNRETQGTLWDDPLTDWLTAEHEFVWKPAVELRQKDGQFEVLAALPGVEAKDLDVRITPEDLLIRAETAHEHTADKGAVHLCEFDGGKLFRSIHFPEKIDPDSVKAEYRNGMLRLTAAIAKAAPQKVEIKAA
jgi:HSP20 family protein